MYIDETWIQGCPVIRWNVSGLSMRTNNHVEGWHNHFYSIVGKVHPNIWHLIEALQKEESATQTTLNSLLLHGHQVARTVRKYAQLNRRVETLQGQYNCGEIGMREFWFLYYIHQRQEPLMLATLCLFSPSPIAAEAKQVILPAAWTTQHTTSFFSRTSVLWNTVPANIQNMTNAGTIWKRTHQTSSSAQMQHVICTVAEF